MPNIVLAVRGNDLNARYSQGVNTPGFFTDTGGVRPVVVNAHESGMIGDHYIDTYHGGSVSRCGLFYDGSNMWSGRPFSFLCRLSRQRAGDLGMFGTGSASGELQGVMNFYGTSGNSVSMGTLRNDAGQEMKDQVVIASNADLNVYHDWVGTCTGALGTAGLNWFRDAANIGAYDLLIAAAATKDKFLSQIMLGLCTNVVSGGWHIEEFVVWDGVIDPSAVQLESGIGALNGPLRTSFVDVPIFNGSLSTDPGVANVITGTSYVINGVDKTGTYLVLAPSNVKVGVDYGPGMGLTGTYNGSDRWTDPGVSNVLEDVDYKANSLTDNRIGTLHLPVSVDPGVGNVLKDVAYEIDDVAKVGTRVFAPNSIADIGVNIVSGDTTGTPVNIFQGEDRTLKFLLVKSDGTPYSLVGVTALTVVFPANSALIEKTLSGGVMITDATNGTLQVVLDNDDTDDLLLATNQSLEMIVENSTNKRIFQSTGVFNVLKPITET
jgi:hypothetical protein